MKGKESKRSASCEVKGKDKLPERDKSPRNSTGFAAKPLLWSKLLVVVAVVFIVSVLVGTLWLTGVIFSHDSSEERDVDPSPPPITLDQTPSPSPVTLDQTPSPSPVTLDQSTSPTDSPNMTALPTEFDPDLRIVERKSWFGELLDNETMATMTTEGWYGMDGILLELVSVDSVAWYSGENDATDDHVSLWVHGRSQPGDGITLDVTDLIKPRATYRFEVNMTTEFASVSYDCSQSLTVYGANDIFVATDLAIVFSATQDWTTLSMAVQTPADQHGEFLAVIWDITCEDPDADFFVFGARLVEGLPCGCDFVSGALPPAYPPDTP